MNRKSLISLAVCYLFWGAAALYWNLFPQFDLVFKVACRVLFSAVFGVICLLATREMHTVREAFQDKSRIKYIILSSVSIGVNWLVYVWAISSGHAVDASLGNYMNPIVISFFGVFLFKEKIDGLQIAAVAVLFAGVLISVLVYGIFPIVGLSQTLTFTAYTIFKKKARTQGMTATTIETGLLAPIALAYMLIFGRGQGGIASIDSFPIFLLILSTGVFTAFPFMLYGTGVNGLPALVVGLAGMLTPTLVLLTGLFFLNETLTTATTVSLIFTLVAIGLFIISLIRKHNQEKKIQTA